MFNSRLQYNGHETVFELHSASHSLVRYITASVQEAKQKNLFSLNIEGLYFHLPRTGVQTILHTVPNERQRIVFIDDP